jgi:hypothetical protein
MKKVLIIVGVIVAVALAKRFGPKLDSIDWEQRIAALPDNALPKWIYQNITTIRENTDQIRRLLDTRETSGRGVPANPLAETHS